MRRCRRVNFLESVAARHPGQKRARGESAPSPSDRRRSCRRQLARGRAPMGAGGAAAARPRARVCVGPRTVCPGDEVRRPAVPVGSPAAPPGGGPFPRKKTAPTAVPGVLRPLVPSWCQRVPPPPFFYMPVPPLPRGLVPRWGVKLLGGSRPTRAAPGSGGEIYRTLPGGAAVDERASRSVPAGASPPATARRRGQMIRLGPRSP